MTLVACFDPPAFLGDFDGIPGQRDAWHEFVSSCFDVSIESIAPLVTSRKGAAAGTPQFYNAAAYDPGGPVVEQGIVWNAFPKELLLRFGRDRALAEADRLWPLSAYRNHFDPDRPEFTTPPASDRFLFRPLDEYCEWHVTRDPRTGSLLRVTFTCEPPEYWAALFGGPIDFAPRKSVVFPGSQARLLALYRELVDPSIALEDLIVQVDFVGGEGEVYRKGRYNPYNKWNTTHGIVHLCAPPNSLAAEITLGADATVLYHDGAGRTLAHPDALICAAGYGGPNRNSDPTIGATVNALARLGAMVTLSNPVGLYMDHIDVNGWELPDGIAARDCVKIVRGAPRMIERLVVEVPPETGRTLSDLRIAGDPLWYAGQIAACITVKLIGAAARIGAVRGNDENGPQFQGLVTTHEPRSIYALAEIGNPVPPGLVPAFASPHVEALGFAAAPRRQAVRRSRGRGPSHAGS